MQVMMLLMLSLVGMGLIAALAVALYASLPRTFLDSAERHGRFHGLRPQAPASNGTPIEALPADAALGGQTA
jgi:hypothetical protein